MPKSIRLAAMLQMVRWERGMMGERDDGMMG
jgi:hypothetical protein